MSQRSRFRPHAAVLAAALVGAGPAALAGPLVADQWGQFSFGEAGGLAAGCDPADPAGLACIPSSGTPTAFLDAPAWTFTAGAGGALLTVVDAFEARDRFEVLDFGVSIGATSALGPTNLVPDCGDDPLVCQGTPGMSLGQFQLGAGSHEITIRVLQSDGLGTAFLQVQDLAQVVAEPAVGALMLAAWAASLGTRRRPQPGVAR